MKINENEAQAGLENGPTRARLCLARPGAPGRDPGGGSARVAHPAGPVLGI